MSYVSTIIEQVTAGKCPLCKRIGPPSQFMYTNEYVHSNVRCKMCGGCFYPGKRFMKTKRVKKNTRRRSGENHKSGV